jgi:molybdopterin-guanine dinucleotide biosynthesis protein A
VSSIILAGGRGLRFGREKALIEFGGENLLQRVISTLASVDDDIILVVAEGQQLPRLSHSKNLKIVTDVYPSRGPLVGVYSGLLASNTAYSLVVACDMPFLNRRLLGYMLQVAAGYDLAIPRLGGEFEPLHAVYSRSSIEAIETLLAEGSLKVDRLLDMVRVRYIETDEIDKFGRQHLSFFNVNTKADLEKAARLAGGVV